MNTPTPSRKKFSGYALMDALEEAQSAHSDGRELHPHLLHDWKRYIEEQFELDDDQRADLDRLCSKPDEKAQRAVLDAFTTAGETPRFTLERKPTGEDGEEFLNELRLDRSSGRETPEAGLGLTIAHCDANCKKWKWGAPKVEERVEAVAE
jgi:hypothetical protein